MSYADINQNYRTPAYAVEEETRPADALMQYVSQLAELRVRRVELSKQLAELEHQSIELETLIGKTFLDGRGRDERLSVLWEVVRKLQEEMPMVETRR